LIESLSAFNRGSIGTDYLVDVVDASVASDGTFQSTCGTRVVCTVFFDDIVLD
jgi:hypothetical protein